MGIKLPDLVGTYYANFYVMDYKRENKRSYLLVKCPLCGSAKWMRKDTLDNPLTVGCGCANKDNLFKAEDLKGREFGNLKVIKKTGKKDSNGSIIWHCLCKCGNYTDVSADNLKTGRVKSCGCIRKEQTRENSKHAYKYNKKYKFIENTNVYLLEPKHLKSNNHSGINGISWDNSRSKWLAKIGFKGKSYYLGRYDKLEDAAKARRIAENKLHGDFLEWYHGEYLKGLEKEDKEE
jgi:hypothetical protein